MRVVIIGNGIAGKALAVALRGYEEPCDIVCLSAEKHFSYDPCSLPYYVSGHIKKKDMFRPALLRNKPISIDVRYNDPVERIYRHNKSVVTRNGLTYEYDKLVLAHGSVNFALPVPGRNLAGVFACKNMDDALALQAHKGGRAVVVGSGAIGVEAAEALKKKGYDEVTIIELLPWIVPAMFDEPAARLLEAGLKNEGINVHCEERLMAVEGTERCEAVRTDKRAMPCDTVVLAAGVVAGRELGEKAGLTVNRGIVVDSFMRTSDRNILACGDCAESFDALSGEPCLYQLKHNAIEQARVAASTILGKGIEYRGAYPFSRINFFNTNAASFGATWRMLKDKNNAERLERQTPRGYLQLIVKDDRLIGGQAVGDTGSHIGLLLGAMWRGDSVDEIRSKKEAIEDFKSPWPPMYRNLARLL